MGKPPKRTRLNSATENQPSHLTSGNYDTLVSLCQLVVKLHIVKIRYKLSLLQEPRCEFLFNETSCFDPTCPASAAFVLSGEGKVLKARPVERLQAWTTGALWKSDL